MSDCALFSFGPIKTATALGGAVVRVRDAELRAQDGRARQRLSGPKAQRVCSRIAKYAAFWLALSAADLRPVVRVCSALGIDYDRRWATRRIRSERTTSSSRFGGDPVCRCCGCSNGESRVQRSRARENATTHRVRRSTGGGAASRHGDRLLAIESHTYWVATVRVENADEVITALRRAGFDATARSSMIVVPAANGSADYDPPLAPWLAEIVFLPNGEDMPESEWDRLIRAEEVARACRQSKSRRGAGRACRAFLLTS